MSIIIRKETYILAGVLAAVLFYWQKETVTQGVIKLTNYIGSRGIRNNNPGNIRKSGDAWQGLSAEQPDKAFFTFDDVTYGIRALTKILLKYRTSYGLNTIRGIITRWAPPSENNTAAYINHVCKVTELGPDDALNYPDDLPGLVSAIILHENGTQPYEDEVIQAGIDKAYA